MFRAALLAAVLLPSLATAADNEVAVTIDDRGHVVARIQVPASSDEVRALLADTGGRLAALSTDTLSVTTTQDGNCEMVDRKTRGIFRPFAFRAKRCPTENGWQETLVQSDDFTAYESEWQVGESSEGTTEVVYRIQTEINAPVPNSIVRTNLKTAAGNMLRSLVDVFRRARVRN
ncbi:MAG: ribosome-associated toxin RatA of RatAB toxin-antitoxin module [Myxococcota bacterium]|jgi:ribosome-associated toxin RatA of RatAB toxin-antitoxin module